MGLYSAMSLSSFVQAKEGGDTQDNGHGVSGEEEGSDPANYSGTAFGAATGERRSAQGQGWSPLTPGGALANLSKEALNPAGKREELRLRFV